ncbi:MAG TPA: SDR family NAD(P)-dependent oxidoreductase [Mycobacteriales bacterium]|nr:SDR family NAD(P)-dependent oxidoreductase [Mycobacteriales bacterium]
MSKTIMWITGATSGIGAAMAASVPYDDVRVINIARRAHPDLETVQADLSRIEDWEIVEAHLADVLGSFRGSRAIFVNNAFMYEPLGFVGEVDKDDYRKHVLVNAAAPLVLGDAFFRHAPQGVEAGLVMISSAAARVPFAARAAYGAGKAAMEQWVRAVRDELAQRESRSWAVAVRPGAVDTPALRADVAADPETNPLVDALAAAYANGEIDSPEVAAARIWDVLPPTPQTPPVVLLGTMVTTSGTTRS